jgi:hypothetical protein
LKTKEDQPWGFWDTTRALEKTYCVDKILLAICSPYGFCVGNFTNAEANQEEEAGVF